MMTPKIYRVFADMFAAELLAAKGKQRQTIARLVRKTAWILQADNERFDRTKFYDACEMPHSERV